MGVLVAGGRARSAPRSRELDAAGHAVTATWIVDAERKRDRGGVRRFGRAFVRADLFDPEETGAAVGAVGELEAVVNLVGGFSAGPRVHETDVADFERMLRLNLLPGFNLAHAAMPLLVERRRRLRRGVGAGGPAAVRRRRRLRHRKAGVLAFVQALDAEYKGDGVRCNAVLPSVIDTRANREAQPDADWSKWVRPEEIAKVSASSSPRTRRPPQAPGFPSTGGLE